MTTLVAATFAVLSNGLRICNFSSPHNFVFDDGTTLSSVEPQRTNSLKLEVREDAEYVTFHGEDQKRVAMCKIRHVMTPQILAEIEHLQEDDTVDLIIVPRVLLDAAKALQPPMDLRKLVTVRLKDRVDKINYHDRFCV